MLSKTAIHLVRRNEIVSLSWSAWMSFRKNFTPLFTQTWYLDFPCLIRPFLGDAIMTDHESSVSLIVYANNLKNPFTERLAERTSWKSLALRRPRKCIWWIANYYASSQTPELGNYLKLMNNMSKIRINFLLFLSSAAAHTERRLNEPRREEIFQIFKRIVIARD